MHLLLRNCHVISPVENINGRFDILIVNGVINRMGVIWQHVREVEQYDLAGKIIVPGFFDMHVHFREPGQQYKEDIASGSLAAAYGGFTGVMTMPNTIPPVDNPELIKSIYSKSKDALVDIYQSACASKGRNGEIISDIELLVKAGVLAITDDGSPVASDNLMSSVLTETAKFNIPVVQHCEVMKITNGGIINEGEVSKILGVKGIPNSSEYEIIKRDIKLTKKIPNSRYHIQHISTKEAVALISKAKAENINVTAEACPHHFILNDESVLKYGTNAKMNPPLRSKEDVEAVIEGLSEGTIEVICTDHAPHSEEEKSLPLDKAPFGIVGLETSIGLTYTYLVNKGIISFEEMIRKMSVNPRRLLGLPEISFKEGSPANLTILDVNKNWTVDKEKFHSKSKNTPFNGWELKCKPVGIVNKHKHLINI
ncbi:MAG: dihydroorotase [Ignavibacteria bacterium]|nr:dihydroorotase [Ignavibacteria bacterium]